MYITFTPLVKVRPQARVDKSLVIVLHELDIMVNNCPGQQCAQQMVTPKFPVIIDRAYCSQWHRYQYYH